MQRMMCRAIFLVSCLLATHGAMAAEKIGVLFGSYGDIDDVNTELRPFIRTTLTDPDVLPLAAWARATVADAGWYIEKKGIQAEYAAIGGRSNMRARSQAQAEAVAFVLQQRGYDVAAYTGFTMTFPFVAEALTKAQADGVNKLYVFYQGAQYSKVTGQIVFRHVKEYLTRHPEWNVQVTAIKSFTDDPRFLDLIAARIDRQLRTSFASYGTEEVCLFFPMHGNVERLSREGDPYVPQIQRVVDGLRARYPSSPLFIGFQNHDEIPFLKWTQPTTDTTLATVAEHSCRGVLINGLISFTVDSLETLYDHAIDEPQVLLQETAKKSRSPKFVVVEKMFNDDQDFVELMANLVEEAGQGQGDLAILR